MLGEIQCWCCAQRDWLLALRVLQSCLSALADSFLFSKRGKNSGAEDLSGRRRASSRRLSARVPRRHRRERIRRDSPLHSTWSASLCGCERHDLVRWEWRRHGQPFPSGFGRGRVFGLDFWPRPLAAVLLSQRQTQNGRRARPCLDKGCQWAQAWVVSAWGAVSQQAGRVVSPGAPASPPANARPPSFQKSTTSSLNRGAPPTRLAGLAGHPRCVRVDNGYDKTRLFTPIRLKTTALPWCGRHHSAQRGRSSPARRGDASAGKGSHRSVPPAQSESGFYSHYFLIPKKDGGLRPILDLRLLNHTLTKRSFRMITLKQILSQIRPGDWFMSLDLKDAYFHIQVAVTDDSWDSHSRGWHINTRSSRLGCPWLPALLRDVWTRLSPLCDRWEFASLTTLTTGSFWPSQKPF